MSKRWFSKQREVRRRQAGRPTRFRPVCEALESRQLLAVFVVTTTPDSSSNAAPTEGSLRSAILAANADTALDFIHFNIGGGGQQTILIDQSTDELPSITSPVTIDGTTQPGTSAQVAPIQIDFQNKGTTGLTLGMGSDGSTLKGVSIVDAKGGGNVALTVASNSNTITQTYIGVQSNGSTAETNTSGVLISGSNNTFGSTTGGSATRNVVSGNTGTGLKITGTRNLVQNTVIGLAADGTSVLANAAGVVISGASNNTIGGSVSGTGNVLSGNLAGGVLIALGSANNIVQNNIIGLDSTGTVAKDRTATSLGNLDGVMIVDSAGNQVLNNLISNNGDDGIDLSLTTSNTLVQGNIVGLDSNGTVPQPNKGTGIEIGGAGGSSNTIGGTSSAARNVIASNTGDGITILAGKGNHQILGNYIGTDKTGSSPRPNGSDGIDIKISSNTVGGSVAGAGNVISGNAGNGILLGTAGAKNNQILGNNIGTDAAGTGPVANLASGISIGDGVEGTTIGGTVVGAGNLIAGNAKQGINIAMAEGSVSQTQIQGNFIGAQRDGKTALANNQHGILIMGGSSKNTIGGTASGAGNVIAFNSLNGVTVGTGAGDTANIQNTISGNSIFGNFLRGIDLGNDGITANDLQDPDVGNNGKQNFPVVTTATTSNGTTTITGTMNGIAGQIIAVEVFASDEADPSGNGEGQTFLGSQLVQLDAMGNAGFSVGTTQNVSGKFLTATATLLSTPPAAGGALGDTSEFSNPFQVGTTTTLSITKTDSPDPVRGGASLAYTLTVSSTGSNSNVVVTDTLPTNATFVSATSSTGTTTRSGNTVTANLGNLTSGASATFTIVVTAPTTAGTISNLAAVVSTENPSGAGQTVTQTTTVQTGNALAVVGPDQGVADTVQVFDADTSAALYLFQPFTQPNSSTSWTGGVRVAVGDFNGDGQDDVVTAAGPGGAPLVSVRNGKDGSQLQDGKLNLFFAFGGPETGNQAITNGVNVAVGDVNGDGTPDIITGTGSGAPLVVVWSGATGTILSAFFAFADNQTFLGGVRVAAADVNGDGKDDVIVGRGPIPAAFQPFISKAQREQATPEVRVYNGANLPASLVQLSGGLVYASEFRGGVYVGGLSGGNVVVGPGEGGTAVADVFSAAGPTLTFVRESAILGSGATGTRVAGIRDQSNQPDAALDVFAGQGPGRTANPVILDSATLATIDSLFTSISGGVFVGASRR